MKKKHIILLVIFLIIVSSSVGFYFMKKNLDVKREKDKFVLYTIPQGEKVFINGVITPINRENIYLDPTKGEVYKLSVEDKQIVKKGDLLFTYKNDAITEQIKGLNRQLNSAKEQKSKINKKKSELEVELKTLQEENNPVAANTESQISVYEDQLDTIIMQIETLEEQIKTLKEKEYTKIKAPSEGKVIISEDTNSVSSPYIIIESTELYIKGSINEKEQPKLRKGQVADILILSTNEEVKGKITVVGNRPLENQLISNASLGSGDSNISYYEVRIYLDSQENLTNGFHIQAIVKLKEETIKISKTAIIKENNKDYVFKVVDNKSVKQEITYESAAGDEVIVKTGLKENDTIIVNPQADMKEGIVIE